MLVTLRLISMGSRTHFRFGKNLTRNFMFICYSILSSDTLASPDTKTWESNNCSHSKTDVNTIIEH